MFQSRTPDHSSLHIAPPSPYRVLMCFDLQEEKGHRRRRPPVHVGQLCCVCGRGALPVWRASRQRKHQQGEWACIITNQPISQNNRVQAELTSCTTTCKGYHDFFGCVRFQGTSFTKKKIQSACRFFSPADILIVHFCPFLSIHSCTGSLWDPQTRCTGRRWKNWKGCHQRPRTSLAAGCTRTSKSEKPRPVSASMFQLLCNPGL